MKDYVYRNKPMRPRQRTLYLLVSLGGIIGDSIALLTLGHYVVNLRMAIVFNEQLDEWSEKQ
jgi:hypothetical protein